jgi:endonuclease/exonuclease/phosphatase family metal-dependent hydrolase
VQQEPEVVSKAPAVLIFFWSFSRKVMVSKMNKKVFLGLVFLCVFSVFSQMALSAEFTFPNGNDRSTIRVISYNVANFRSVSLVNAQGCPRFESGETTLARIREQLPLRIALELGLYRPDIITMAEATGKDKVKQIADYLGMNYVYFPGNGKWAGTVITRYKILESQQNPVVDGNCPAGLFTRHWIRAVLQAGDSNIIVHSIHLHPVDEQIRIREINEVIKVVKKDIQAGYSVLVQGDFNLRNTDPEYRLWIDAGLTDTFVEKGIGEKYSYTSHCPQKRIDYIWTAGPIQKNIAEHRILREGSFALHPDSLSDVILSDHLPVIAVFQNPEKLTDIKR